MSRNKQKDSQKQNPTSHEDNQIDRPLPPTLSNDAISLIHQFLSEPDKDNFAQAFSDTLSTWSHLQHATTLQEQIRILFANAIKEGCPKSVLEDFLTSVARYSTPNLMLSHMFVRGYYLATGNIPNSLRGSYITAENQDVPGFTQPQDLKQTPEEEILQYAKNTSVVMTTYDYESIYHVLSDARIGNVDDIVHAVCKIKSIASQLTVEQAGNLFNLLNSLKEDARVARIKAEYPPLQRYAIRDAKENACIALLPKLDTQCTTLWLQSVVGEYALKVELLLHYSNMGERYERAAKELNMIFGGHKSMTIFTLTPYLTDTQKVDILKALVALSVFQEWGALSMGCVAIRLLAHISNPHETLEHLDKKSTLYQLLQKTLPYFVPHIPLQSVSNSVLSGGKNEKQERLNQLIKQFNEKLALYMLRQNTISVTEHKRELCETFQKIILTTCEERKPRFSLFSKNNSEPTYSTTTHSATQLIQYLYSPEAKKVRGILNELMPTQFPEIEPTAFSTSLQAYMKTTSTNAIEEARSKKNTASQPDVEEPRGPQNE